MDIFFKKDPAAEDKKRRLQFIMSQQPEDKYRRPGPLGNNKFPDHNFIDFYVTQDDQKIKLHVYRYPPGGPGSDFNLEPRAIVIAFHGLNSHIDRYAYIARELSQNSFCAVVGFDHRGFGRSEGFRGLVESEEQHLNDSRIFIKMVIEYYKKQFQKDIPIFLMGQSMGGMTIYSITLQSFDGIRGTILFNPSIKDNEENAKFGKMIARGIGGLFPRFLFVSGGSQNLSEKNPQAEEESKSDPYIYRGKIVPGTIKFLLNGMDKYSKTFSQYKCPFLIITGGIDKMVDPDIGQLLISQAQSNDKQLIFKENMWHNAIQEEEIYEILPMIIEWINKRI